MFRRISAISLTYAGVLAFNTLYIQSIGSGIGLYSGLFKVSVLSNFIALFILIISSVIILIWPNFDHSSMNLNQENNIYNLSNTLSLSSIYPSGISSSANGEQGVESKERNKAYVGFYNFIRNESKSNEYCLIIFFNILGALFLISSFDLISIYLSIELQSFGLYILATLYKEKYSSTSAGLKYFLLGGLSSCIILLGCGLVYSTLGLTNLESIYSIISTLYHNFTEKNTLMYEIATYSSYAEVEADYGLDELYELEYLKGVSLGLLLIFAGFLFKIAASPFHNWAPDVYDDTPTLVTVWLTVMPKISILILFLELMIYYIDLPKDHTMLYFAYFLFHLLKEAIWYPEILNEVFPYNFKANFDVLDILTKLLILSSFLSLIIGSIVGLSQVRIKRLLAYSTISHIGFLLLALSVFSKSSIEAFIFYIIQYTITNVDIFLIILAFGYIFKIKVIPTEPSNLNNSINNSVNNNINNSLSVSTEKLEKNKNIITNLNLLDFEYISNLKGIFYKNPLLSISFSICLFSFAGVPPLIGFFAKQQVLYASNSAGFFFLSLVAILVSVISASYYLKIIRIIHTYPNSNNKETSANSSVSYATQAEQGFRSEAVNNEIVKFNKEVNIRGYYGLFTSTHAFLIGILTLSIVLFIFNPELLYNSISIITNLFFNI